MGLRVQSWGNSILVLEMRFIKPSKQKILTANPPKSGTSQAAGNGTVTVSLNWRCGGGQKADCRDGLSWQWESEVPPWREAARGWPWGWTGLVQLVQGWYLQGW